jgi:DcmR-like sensory protein
MPGMRTSGTHAVGFYGEAQPLVERVAEFLEAGIRANNAAILIATQEHVEMIERAIAEHGLDLEAARKRGQYVTVDAAEALASFMGPAGPDRKLFNDSIGRVLADAQAKYLAVRIYGEMVSLLWLDGKSVAALALEALWNEVIGDRLSLLCGYMVGALGHSANELDGVVAAHTEVVDPDPRAKRSA